MEHKALAALMVRLLGLWQLVVAITAIPNAIGPFFNPQYVANAGLWAMTGVALFSVALPFAIGLLLIYFPRTVATQALRIEGIEPAGGIQTTSLEKIAVSTLGLWLTIQALLDTAYTFSKWKLYSRIILNQFPDASGPAIGPAEFSGLITAALQLALGLWLLLGARGLANAFARFRGQESGA
jgi:hypothetical protein